MVNKQNNKGFTIIEVLIVLAIAGLIMLIVFLAVPALQRNARNQSRQSDGAKLSAAITQCLSNNNGRVANCNSNTAVGASTGISWTSYDYGQLTTQPTYAGDVAGTTNATTGASTTKAVWLFGARCEGSAASTADVTSREFVVIYRIEGSGTPQACIGSQG
jgi:prepilin-type N-terminal cleavage/methylation domain-containing protein